MKLTLCVGSVTSDRGLLLFRNILRKAIQAVKQGVDHPRPRNRQIRAHMRWQCFDLMPTGRKNRDRRGLPREHGYRLKKIAAHLGVHYATVTQKLKKIEGRI